SRALHFLLLTLFVSLQPSYAAPLLLLAQNRQDDRERVVAEEDRKRGQQNLADTEYLTREIESLRIALREVATRDYVRSELRSPWPACCCGPPATVSRCGGGWPFPRSC
ncbi:DUF1003 domain-containing protein, partial [Kocuria rhizophila]